MTPLLTASGIEKRFRLKGGKGLLTAVDQVSLDLHRGETLGLAGESGCGKSTLAKIMTGLLPPDCGSVCYMGQNLQQLDKKGKGGFRRAVQMIFQDPFSSLNPRIRIGDTVAEPLLIQRLHHPSTIRGEAVRYMEQVGLSAEDYDRFPHQFSGGQRQRIGIARALAASPSILVADEPVSSLDISIQAQIINLLQELKDHHRLTMLVVSHDLSVLRHLSDRIAVMYLGSILELAPARMLFESCRHPYSKALLTAIPSIAATGMKTTKGGGEPNEPPSAINLPTGCRFHPRCRHAEDICRTKRPELKEKQPGHQVACHLNDSIFSKL